MDATAGSCGVALGVLLAFPLSGVCFFFVIMLILWHSGDSFGDLVQIIAIRCWYTDDEHVCGCGHVSEHVDTKCFSAEAVLRENPKVTTLEFYFGIFHIDCLFTSALISGNSQSSPVVSTGSLSYSIFLAW